MKFTIRDLLWLTIVCAVVMFAYRDRRNTQQRMAEAEAAQAQERIGLEKSLAEFEHQRQIQEAELREREALVRVQMDELKLSAKAMKEAHAMDEAFRRRFPEFSDPARKSWSLPKNVE
jgi:hypothetical protein